MDNLHSINEKLRHIRLLLLDVDGVLTDGSIVYNENGSEIKVFNVKDGMGITLLIEAGIQVGIMTGRWSKALEHRCKDLGISLVFQGVKHKELLIDDILEQLQMSLSEVAFAGDDINDAAIMKKIGLSIAVQDAHPDIKKIADITTTKGGGKGAVREICEAILVSQGLWKS